MSWRDVPMPDGVASRPRSEGGLPIPYVAAWEGEAIDRIGPDPVLVRALGVRLGSVFSSAPAPGARAQLGVMEPSRQRRVVIERLCQVCTAELGERHRPNPPWRQPLWLVDLRISGADDGAGEQLGHDLGGQTIRVGRRVCPLVFEPWVCEDCLAYALEVCPGMLKVRAGRYRHPLRLLRVRRADPIAVTGRVGGEGPTAGQTADHLPQARGRRTSTSSCPASFLAERQAVTA